MDEEAERRRQAQPHVIVRRESERMDDGPRMEIPDNLNASQSIAEPMDGQALPSLSDIVALLDSASIPHELQLKPTTTPKKGCEELHTKQRHCFLMKKAVISDWIR
ncbi:hypothetical protein BLNAU_8694 [Blattamonas nauphoetae]|uniref:Uncharacterized protein n=1 Tax=Blattamonas nauphoetae TaxID=2049346 RepID=A0ABQ9XXV7_9EUKA|nr:hypothetical protein BLNAU_8694 [Blattamonas nauphoetae]